MKQGIIIWGMEMPEACYKCFLQDNKIVCPQETIPEDFDPTKMRLQECPLQGISIKMVATDRNYDKYIDYTDEFLRNETLS